MGTALRGPGPRAGPLPRRIRPPSPGRGAPHVPRPTCHRRTLLYAAHRSAREIGAELLARGIGDFAGRAGITLDRPAPTDPDREPAATEFSLTDRETEVLRLLSRGLTNGEIARELFISAKTASVHVSAILRKLGVTSRIQASTMANGILGDGRD